MMHEHVVFMADIRVRLALRSCGLEIDCMHTYGRHSGHVWRLACCMR